jgi:hypothetical protein
VLPGNYVYRWIHMILIYFDLQHRNPYATLFEPFNRIYNAHLSPYDYREPCYRYVIAISTDPAIDVQALRTALRHPPEPPTVAGETDAMLVRTLREIDATAADQLRQCGRDIEYLVGENARKAENVARLNQENAAKAAEIARLEAALRESQRGLLGRARRLARRIVTHATS